MTNTDRLAEWLCEQTSAFAAHVRDFAAPVPTCPEWTVRDLVAHIGQEHRWAADIVRTGRPPAVPDPRAQEVPGDWASWLHAGARELIDVVGAGTAPVWTFLGDRPARFWLRRMVHDTAVHHADLAGRAPVIPAGLASDAVEEVLGFVTAPGAAAVKPALAELRGDGQTLLLRPTDRTPWLITRGPAGPTWRRGDADADVTVSATARDLLLIATRRLPPDDPHVTISGDRVLLDHWLAHTAL
jgi:uncharacterized protein (TIGR03083 family)